ncbi:molybdopterin molybdotransferase MoeA [Gramella jeungdoensis]|uniref:Molybdopterin molybdenumtransferase n=1 Tax=Gramella jeungdoensis TaxID=708091 RepID=A0ABT0Z057_9FLAO|nr:gephyrin-like molybdotransferase Glp [Gramella jeungdoensis]MCM8569102.1 molybdopterin molybdotransferase MoeA [Gramella jeungdoensis]
MISVRQALSLIQKHTVTPVATEVHIEQALGQVLAKDILSPIAMPPFTQSAMDGYAIRLSTDPKYKVIGESKAGDNIGYEIKKGEAVRIFTGAVIPEYTDTVVIQEHVEIKGNNIFITKLPAKGANIRLKGEQLSKNDLVLTKGHKINEASIGLLAGLGVQKLKIFQTPKTGILVTGNELQVAGTPLIAGKIYESNSVMLKSALKRNGFGNTNIYNVRDDISYTNKVIKKALSENDVLLISGGISVGKYDFVREALLSNSVKEVFYKINQKPGKPLWFGARDKKRVFALPGNPAASLVCFYIYVLPELRRQKGFTNRDLKISSGKLSRAQENRSGKSLFLKAKVNNTSVEILDGQSSAMLHSFSQANALVLIPESKKIIEEGEKVEYLELGYE